MLVPLEVHVCIATDAHLVTWIQNMKHIQQVHIYGMHCNDRPLPTGTRTCWTVYTVQATIVDVVHMDMRDQNACEAHIGIQ